MSGEARFRVRLGQETRRGGAESAFRARACSLERKGTLRQSPPGDSWPCRLPWFRAAPPHHFNAKPQRTQSSQRFLGRALAKPVRERPWLKSYLWRDQPRTNTDALRLRLRKFPRGGATAPDQGNCRGRASRGRDEPDATLKRASCVVGPVARPSAVPRQIGKAASQHGKAGKSLTQTPSEHQ